MGLLAALKTWVDREILTDVDLDGNFGAIRDWANTSAVLVDVDALVTAYHRFHAGAQFDAAIDVTAGGAFIVGNSEIAGTLTGLTAIGVIGPVDVVGALTQTGNQDVTGSVAISGALDVGGALNAASITGPFTVPANRVTTGVFGAGAFTFVNGAVAFTNPGNVAGAVRSSEPFPEPRAGSGGFLIGELVRPGHQGAPDDLIHKHDHCEHREQADELPPPIAAFDGKTHIRAETWQPKIVFAQNKCLADHQEEPATGHGHHAVPE